VLKGYSFNSIFDAVDAVLATDDATNDLLHQMSVDTQNGIDTSMPFQEAAEENESVLQDCDPTEIDTDNCIDVESPMDHDTAAEDYIAAAKDLIDGTAFDNDDMIDIIMADDLE